MKKEYTKSTPYSYLKNPDTVMVLWPLIGLSFVLGLSVIYNQWLWGGSLVNIVGYLIPAGVGGIGGGMCALWYRQSQLYLDEARTRSLKFEEQSRRYELMFQSTGEGIYEVDSQGECLFINRAALEMLGYEEDELLGQNIHNRIDNFQSKGKELPICNCPIQNVARDNQGVRIADDTKSRKDGSTFIADTLAYPVVDGETSNIIVMFRDVTEERKLDKRIRHMATFDSLTGLQNRYSFEQSLKLAIESVGEENRQHALCYIDLDQFKIINDTAGHVAGDAMLQELSSHLGENIREGDILGRLGGDEFGLLLHDCRFGDIHSVIQNLQKHTEQFKFQWENQLFKVSLSIGVCLLDTKIINVTQALKLADQACYMAKDSGRNRYHVYNSENNEFRIMNEEMNWVARINGALEEDRFFLRYQLIERLSKRKKPLKQFEVLISMREESGTILAPGSFLPAAERYNLMPLIDRWVVRKAFAWLESNMEEQNSLDFVSINLSGDSITDDSFLEFIQTELKKHSFAPAKVCFEITETAAIEQMHKAIYFIRQIKKIGCRFALDDFGSGMASFAYLKHLPINFIKIDGSFVHDMTRNPLSYEIVKSIHKIARVMQITTIAEHAEDQATLEALKAIGIDYVQGYIIARPEVLPFD